MGRRSLACILNSGLKIRAPLCLSYYIHIPKTIYDIQKKEKIHKTTYDIQIISWTKINGVRRRWNFKFKDGQIHHYATLILDRFSGDYILDEDLPKPSKGRSGSGAFDIIQRTTERTESVLIKNHSNEEITFSNSLFDHYQTYVVVKDDGISKPVSERTVIIELSDFFPLSDVDVEVTIEKGGTVHTLFNQVIPVDASGNANHNWEIPSDVHTGKCKITANGINTKYFFVYRTRSDDIPSEELNYNYQILYGDQFTSFNEAVIETFADNITTSFLDVYNEEISNWHFPSPVDIDLDENLDIYVVDDEFAFAKRYHDTINDSLYFDCIAIGFSYIDYLRSNYNYSTDLDAIQASLSHEFLHSVQFHYYNIIMNWDQPINGFIIEGQARFIQTVYMDYHSSGPNEEFEGGRQYQYQANQYLLNDLNLSLEDVSYDYCLFWRFLYENYRSGGESDKLDILIEFLEKSDVVGSDPITDGEIAFNNALSAGGGLYSSFDDAIKDFAKKCYLNDTLYTQWDPCPSDAFYVTPFITAANRDGITNTFTGERNVTETDAIPEPFGIDYMIFNIGATVNNVCLNFNGDPDDDSDMVEFYANALLMEGNDLISEKEILLSNGKGVISFEPNDPINKIVLIIARLDSDETRENDYEVILSDDVIHVSGNVSGTWTNTNATYTIDGDITISTGNTLIIEPGIKVDFSGHYKFEIYGRFLAEGTEDANIIFTAQNQTTGWNGLHFIDQNTNGQDSSKVVNCKLQYGRATDAYPNNCGGAIYLENSDILIDNCIISYNSADRDGGGIYVYNSSSPIIRNSIICNNSASTGGGISVYNSCTPYLENVCIYNNIAESEIYGRGGGIFCDSFSYPNLTNVTISNNTANHDSPNPGGGLFCSNYSYPSLINCILWDNIPQEIGDIDFSAVTVEYSDVKDGTPGVGNIDADPLFSDPTNGDFQITWANYPVDDATKSPCIDTGNPSSPLDPDDTIIDMGAFYFHQYETGISAPEDVIVTIDADSVYITWSASRNRTTYKVYSSNDPYLDFTEDLTGTYNETNWTAPFPTGEDKKFYYVTSSDEREQAQIEILEKNKRILK